MANECHKERAKGIIHSQAFIGKFPKHEIRKIISLKRISSDWNCFPFLQIFHGGRVSGIVQGCQAKSPEEESGLPSRRPHLPTGLCLRQRRQ